MRELSVVDCPPEDAYRFARGDEVETSTAGKARLARPLDFLVVADHSDNMGFFPDLFAGAPHLLADPVGKKWYEMVKNGEGHTVALEIIDSFSRAKFPEKMMYYPRHQALQEGLGEDDCGGGKVQRPGPFHGVYRLRMDFAGSAGKQPASRRRVP